MIYQDGAPPWLLVANLEEALRVQEYPGERHNERVVFYHSFTTLRATDDETPWCSAFICCCIETCGLGLESTKSARARSHLAWGVPMTYPALGCIVVMSRGGGTQPGPEVLDAKGHVGFFAGFEQHGKVLVRGGNQSNRVCTKAYEPSRVLGYRWVA
jgi:uncharacterized protein (TIGR02594 family)